MIQAVIFDFDGVIGDTMPDNCRAWQAAFAAYNFNVPAAEYYRLEGMGRYQIAEHFINKYALDPAMKNDVVTAKELYYKNNNSFRIYDGVAAIFEYLVQKQCAIAIVTGASRTRIMEHTEDWLLSQVQVLITADDVTNTKPHAEPYLKACEQLGLAPANCLVVENAILGVESAKAAGCMCYALETTLGAADLQAADAVYGTHKELLDALKNRI